MTDELPSLSPDKRDCPECGETLKIHFHRDGPGVYDGTCWYCHADVRIER